MKLKEALEALGTTTDSVSEKLRSLGIKGIMGEQMSCPIARYLRTCGFTKPGVGQHEVVAWEESYPVDLTNAVKAWVNNFDMGAYPDFDINFVPILKAT